MKNIYYQAPFITKVKSLWIILLALLFTAAACKKEEEPIHRNVFRCEVNGVPWEAGCDSQNLIWNCDYMDCQYYEDIGGFEIAGTNNDKTRGVSFRKSSLDGGVFTGNNIFTKMTYGQEGVSYNLKEGYNGVVHIILIDFSYKIIEGEFNFIAHSISGDSVKINNGYFKTKYRP